MLPCGGKNKDDNGKHTERLDGKILVKYGTEITENNCKKVKAKHMAAMFEMEKTTRAGTSMDTTR